MKQYLAYLLILLACSLQPVVAQNNRTQSKKKAQKEVKGKTSAKQKATGKATTKGGQRSTRDKKPAQKETTQKQQKYVATKEIKGLQQENQRIKQEIKQHEAEYQEKQRDVDTRLKKIITLDTEIEQHEKEINDATTDINSIDENIAILKTQLNNLEQQLGERRARFIRSMRYMARHRSIQDKVMFVFSAKSLSQMYRRLRFVREYAAYQRAQGERLQQKQRQVDEKRTQLSQVRQQKNNLRYQRRQAKAAVANKKAEQQRMVETLQQDQKVLQKVISDRKKKQQALDAQIERLINIEIRKARERAAAEAKKRAAEQAAEAKKRAEALAKKREAAKKAAEENARRIAEAKRKEAEARKREAEARAKAKAEAEKAEKERQRAEAEAREAKREKERKAAEKRAREAEERAREAEERKERAEQQTREAEAQRQAAERKAAAEKQRHEREVAEEQKRTEAAKENLSSADRAMTGSFANSKGRLPMPISGRIVSHFGDYNVEGLSGVKLNNSGINIKASAGAPVKSVFKGEVSSIFSYGGTTVVMVRHGAYITVYANLRSVSVRQGQQVGTGQTLGTVDSNGILQFQLRKETTKLNPEAWLR